MKKVVELRDAIAVIQPRQFIRLESVSAGGSLELRKSKKGVLSFYYRFSSNGKTDRQQIGLYDSSAPPKSTNPTSKGFSLTAARSAAADWAAKHYEAQAVGGLRKVLKNEAAQAQKQKDLAAVAGFTFEKLIYVYADTRANPETAKQVRNLFAKNVKSVFPGLAATQANQVSSDQIADVLRKIMGAGRRTTARKLKAYLRSAFEHAKNVSTDSAISKDFEHFKVVRNPVAEIAGIANSRGVDKNPLMPEEMREYWQLINMPGKEAAFLRLHLLLGGQRVEQLVRLKSADVTAGAITLEDTKGRSGNMRYIHVPLIPAAASALNELRSDGPFALSLVAGRHMSASTARRWAKQVLGDSLESFTLKRVRSGVTTLLAKLRVDKEVRNHLQSHNLGGVDSKHYNMYDFLDEKKEALAAMYVFLVDRPRESDHEVHRQKGLVKRRGRGLIGWKRQVGRHFDSEAS